MNQLPKFYLDVKTISSLQKNTTNTYESPGIWNSFSDSVAWNLEDDFHFILNNRKRLRLQDGRTDSLSCTIAVNSFPSSDSRMATSASQVKMVRYIVHSAVACYWLTQHLWKGEQQCSDLSYCMFSMSWENVLTALRCSIFLVDIATIYRIFSNLICTIFTVSEG